MFSVKGTEEQISMYNVIYEVNIASGELSQSKVNQSRYESIEWSSSVPSEQEGAMAEDIRLFI